MIPEETLTLEDAFTQAVYERQAPLQRSTDEMEERYSQLQAQLKRPDLCSICALPLTTVHRKLGVISFGSKQVDAYTRDEIGFVSQLADQIALAFDDALNFTALRRASEELQSKNDQLEPLLEVRDQRVDSNRPMRFPLPKRQSGTEESEGRIHASSQPSSHLRDQNLGELRYPHWV